MASKIRTGPYARIERSLEVWPAQPSVYAFMTRQRGGIEAVNGGAGVQLNQSTSHSIHQLRLGSTTEKEQKKGAEHHRHAQTRLVNFTIVLLSLDRR